MDIWQSNFTSEQTQFLRREEDLIDAHVFPFEGQAYLADVVAALCRFIDWLEKDADGGSVS